MLAFGSSELGQSSETGLCSLWLQSRGSCRLVCSVSVVSDGNCSRILPK